MSLATATSCAPAPGLTEIDTGPLRMARGVKSMNEELRPRHLRRACIRQLRRADLISRDTAEASCGGK